MRVDKRMKSIEENNGVCGKNICRSRRKAVWAMTCLLTGIILSGCSLALEEITAAQQDQLVGVFVTGEYVTVGTPELEIDRRGEIKVKEQEEKLYGSVDTFYGGSDCPVSFDGLEGFGIYSMQIWDENQQSFVGYSTADPFFDELRYDIIDRDIGKEENMEGVLYVDGDSFLQLYVNPVYQQADGSVYLVQGKGLSSDSMGNGVKFSQSIGQTVNITNGEAETESNRKFTVQVVGTVAASDMELLFMDKGNDIIQALSGEQLEELCQEQWPQLEVPQGVEYLILQQTGKNGDTTRDICSKGQDSLRVIMPTGSIYLRPCYVTLIWK